MNVQHIVYHPACVKDFKKLSVSDRQRAINTEKLFRESPLHPSLRLHPLKVD